MPPNYLPASGYSSAFVEFQVHCAACDQIAKEGFGYFPGQQIVNPRLPEGWKQLNRKFYCPKHSLLVLVDGKEIYPEF